MAKTQKSAPEQEGEISVSIVKFTMKGSDASLQKGLDTIKAAFAQAGFGVVPEQRQFRHDGARPALAAAEDADVDSVDEVQDEDDVKDAAPAPAPAPRRAAGSRKQPNYKVLPEIQIDDVSPTLKEFVLERHAESDLKRYLVIAYWFKHTKKIEDLTTEHWFTAYKLLGWTPPANPAQPVADLRHQRRQNLSSGATKGTWTINNVGEKIVMGLSKAPA